MTAVFVVGASGDPRTAAHRPAPSNNEDGDLVQIAIASAATAYPTGLAARVQNMARGRADIANTALRIFLQEVGAAYDQERGLMPYRGAKDFAKVKEFFGGRCCYCDDELTSTNSAQDHLIPVNKTSLGLHAWGNVVPACSPCNARKQGREWRDFIIERAGEHAAERHARMKSFLDEYNYNPTQDLKNVAEELYDEIGAIAMTLIEAKIKQARKKI